MADTNFFNEEKRSNLSKPRFYKAFKKLVNGLQCLSPDPREEKNSGVYKDWLIMNLGPDNHALFCNWNWVAPLLPTSAGLASDVT